MSNGYSAPTGDELRQEFENTFETEFDETIDWTRDRWHGAMSAAVGQIAGLLAESVQNHYDQRFLGNATGQDLEDLVGLAGVTRDPATASRVDLEFLGNTAEFVPMGTELTGPSGNTWVTTEDGDVNGPSIPARCETLGPVEAPDGSTFEVVSPIPGLNSVTADGDASLGNSEQTDAELLAERRREFATGTSGRTESLYNDLTALDFIDNAVVVSNRKPTAQTVDGISLGDFETKVLVWPNSLSAEQEDTVAETIFESLSPSTPLAGSVTRTVTTPWGTDVDVSFEYALQLTVNLVVNIYVSEPTLESTIVEEVRRVVLEYFGDLEVGQDVRTWEITARIGDLDNARFIDDIDYSTGGSDDGEGDTWTVPPTAVAIPNTGVVAQ
jgi:hypothetical protein